MLRDLHFDLPNTRLIHLRRTVAREQLQSAIQITAHRAVAHVFRNPGQPGMSGVTMHDRALLGRRGEKHAERYLRRLGYRIITRNYTCPAGEIDLVALDGETIVFTEIKTRTDEDAEQAFRAITPEKRRHMISAAKYFLQHTHRQNHPCRFDVVAVMRDERDRLLVEHAPNAMTIRG